MSHTKNTNSKTPKKSNPESLNREIAWSIRGVSYEAKQSATKRAKQENKFIGAYITDLILMDAKNATQSKNEIARQEDHLSMYEALKKQQDEQKQEIRELKEQMERANNNKSFWKRMIT